MVIYGVNPVIEALRAGRASVVRVSSRGGERLREIERLAAERGVPVRRIDPRVLDNETRGGVHQGVVAEAAPIEDYTPAHLVDAARSEGAAPLIVALDGVEDPHNVGAILRTIDAAGAHGLIRQERRSAHLGGAAAKASAGAIAHVRIATVVNVARAVEELSAEGVWSVGLASEASERYDEIDLTLPTAIVAGAEGAGLRRLVRERCDRVVAIPMAGRVSSLNVSVAVGVMLFEAARQRRAAQQSRREQT